MVDIKIVFSLVWVATMLCYLLGDVLRIYAGDFKPGEIGGKPVSHKMYFGIAIIMVIPIIMVVLSIFLENPVISWINLIVACFFLIFNLVGIGGYKAYDIFILIVSFGFNGIIIWLAITQLL